MYQFSYSEILADSPLDARENERDALRRAIAMLTMAERGEPNTVAEQEALSYLNMLWAVFIKDLAHPENDLPAECRAGLMSIGLWVMSHIQRIQAGETRDFAALVEICTVIEKGLE